MYLSFDRLLNWRQWFGKSTNADDDHAGKDEVVGILQMVCILKWNTFWLILWVELKFRFADHTDILLMGIVMFISVLEACFFVAGIVLFGRLSGAFAMESFANTCRRQQQQNFINTMKYNVTCPLGIILNPVNFNHMHK